MGWWGGVGLWVAYEILVTAQVLGFHLGLDFGLGLVNSYRQTDAAQVQMLGAFAAKNIS